MIEAILEGAAIKAGPFAARAGVDDDGLRRYMFNIV
jgi:hypothetical protein